MAEPRDTSQLQPILARLMAVIESRKAQRPTGSYTTQLFEGGAEQIGAKVREEAAELVEACLGAQQPKEMIHEAADLLYHMLVLLAHSGLTLADVERELERRFGNSGLETQPRP